MLAPSQLKESLYNICFSIIVVLFEMFAYYYDEMKRYVASLSNLFWCRCTDIISPLVFCNCWEYLSLSHDCCSRIDSDFIKIYSR